MANQNRMENELDRSGTAQIRALQAGIREPLLILNSSFEILGANENFYTAYNLTEAQSRGASVFSLHNSSWDLPALKKMLGETLRKRGQVQDIPFDLPVNPSEFRHSLLNVSVFPQEEKHLILITFEPKGSSATADLERKSFMEELIRNSPVMICTLHGPNHIFKVANDKYYDLIGDREIIGKPIVEVLPEIQNQGFIEILDEVYETGKSYVGREVPVTLKLQGEDEKKAFVDFVYQPIYDDKEEVNGIFVNAVDVTEKVEFRQNLEKSERELQNLVNTLPTVVWISDVNGKNVYLNDSWRKLTGQSEEDSKDMGSMDVVHPEDRGKVMLNFSRSLKERSSYEMYFRLRTRNNDYRWMINRASPMYDIDGNYTGLTGVILDVHDNITSGELIREKELRTKNIVEEATVATAVYMGEDMKIELANNAMISLWGKDRSVIGKTLREALPELEGQPFFDLLDQVYTTGEIYWGKEDRVDLMIDGKMQTGYFNFTYKPLRNAKGEIYGILNMAMDVTEQWEARKKIEESERHFRQMADLMPAKVLNLDTQGNMIFFNQHWLEYTGLTSEELKKSGWTSRIHPDDLPDYQSQWEHSRETGQNLDMEIRLKSKEGDCKWHLSRAEAVRDENGIIKMWIATNTDIQRLKEEEKRKEDFLKMVSHELKTPVTSIKGYIQLLLTMLKSAKEQKAGNMPLQASLQRIDHQIHRLTRLISEMLDLSRIEENKLLLQKEVFSINELVKETVQDIQFTNTQHQISIVHSFEGHVEADRDRIGQVLINLIINAIKYSPDRQEVQVVIEEGANKEVIVKVIDEGIGIDEKDHQNIFKRFFRITEEEEDTYSGFGIGLFLANEIIERHQGTLDVKSEKGKGSEFSFTLSLVS